jgi:hypothetical protein
MARSIDDFWQIWNNLMNLPNDLTEALDSISKSNQKTANEYFARVIDTIAHQSPDYTRTRAWVRDWYASHSTISTFQQNISDVYEIPNDQLDILFQSFGYDLSSSIKDPISNEPLLIKVNFFLDLVNLYKKKGTPQTMVDVLQYYGINELDIYEFDLQFDDRPQKDPTDLMFKGTIVAGTTGDDSPLYLPYDLLTEGDPHWIQTEANIRALYPLNNINFPSRSPYFAIKPLFDERTFYGGVSILVRTIQDQYFEWKESETTPEENAISTITGDQVSILALYLACIYIFNLQFSVGTPGKSFICYDGTSSEASIILDEFDYYNKNKPDSRADQRIKLREYYDLFSRVTPRNFLQNETDAGDVLEELDPTFKNNLDSLGNAKLEILCSLLNDLGEWVRSNISYGFMNLGYLLCGFDSLISQMGDVVNFWKPYRARLIPLEMLEFRSRLTESIIVEDRLDTIDVEPTFHDFLTGDSSPCCGQDATACFDATTAPQFYSREYYDCGSYHDLGAVTDMPQELFIEVQDNIHDGLNCVPADLDSTAIVTSEVLTDTTSTYFLDTTSGDTLVELSTYYQSGGFADFDSGGTFDCTHGFDLVEIEMIETTVPVYLLQEDGGKLDLEDGSGSLLQEQQDFA